MVQAISMPTIGACKKAYTLFAIENSFSLLFVLNIPPLKRTPCIYYLFCFKKDQAKVHTLLDSNNEVNAMAYVYAINLGLKIRPTNFRVQKIDSSTFKIFGIVVASFRINNKLNQSKFFQETFLLAKICIKVILNT